MLAASGIAVLFLASTPIAPAGSYWDEAYAYRWGEGCDFCILPPPPLAGLDSSVRMLDCTSVALDRGPYLPASAQAAFRSVAEERYPRNPAFARWDQSIFGVLRYSSRGELEAISLQVSEGHIGSDRQLLRYPNFQMSADSVALYPLKSRTPMGACDSPTLVTFHCTSDGSPCSLTAAPA